MLIYIVEDDANIRQMESYALRGSDYQVTECATAQSFWKAFQEKQPDLIILDIMLPEEDGMHILGRLKNNPKTEGIPIIIVTAKDSELDMVTGLEAGADDYISKPFGIMPFLARVKAVLRRSTPTDQVSYRVGGIVMDENKRMVYANNIPCSLTFTEYELLRYLLQNSGIVLSRERIMDKIWGSDYEGESRTVDMHIKALRRKLGDCGMAIQTVRNVGYKLES